MDGRTFVGTLGVRYELPVQTARFRPYLSGGLGINNTSQGFRVGLGALMPSIDDVRVAHRLRLQRRRGRQRARVPARLWADVDAKYFRLSRERNIMRLGGGVSVRF